MGDLQAKIELLKKQIRAYPDYPKPGVLFRDIFSLFRQPEMAALLRDVLIQVARTITPNIECVVALDARGFLIGPLIALALEVPFVPVRKKGKLPGEVLSMSYDLEYGKDVMEIQKGSIVAGQKVLLVDDLLATGGSLATAQKLVESLGGQVVGCLTVIELESLKGRDKLDCQIYSLMKY